MNVSEIEREKKMSSFKGGIESLNAQLTFQTERIQEKAAVSILIRMLV